MADCTAQEFAQNFKLLESKYTALAQQLESEQQISSALRREIAQRDAALQDQNEEVARLKKDLEEAQGFKDKYFATSIAMESLKGRLESARKAITDRDTEHQHEVEQLRAQITDLFRRIEVTSDAPLLNALRAQKGELEERCAISNGQLLEERERTNQQLVTANGALRDAQSRCVELEQRCRALDSEVTSMRQSVRNYNQQANDAVLERERLQLENSKLQANINSLESEAANMKLKMEEHDSSMTMQRLEHQRKNDHEVTVLHTQLREKEMRVEEAIAQRANDAEKYHALQRTMQQKIGAAREESRLEIERLQRDLDIKTEALGEAQARIRAATSEEQELKRVNHETDLRLQTAERARHSIQLQLDEALQATSWANAEKDRANQTIQRMQQQLDESTQQSAAHGSTQLDLERMKLQLHYATTELGETKKQLEGEHYKQQTIVRAYEVKIQELQKELKETRKDYKNSLQRLEKHKRKLMMHVTEKEHELAAMMAMPATTAGSKMAGGRAAADLAVAADGDIPISTSRKGAGVDAVALLMAQSVQAEETQRALTDLTKGH